MDLRQLRERAGLTTEDVASKLKISHSTFWTWESGKREPSSVSKIVELMNLYQCSFEEFTSAVAETKRKAEKPSHKSA